MSFCAGSYILVSTVYFYPLFIIFFKDRNVYWFGNRDVICFDQTTFLDLKVLNQVLQFLGCCHFWLTDWVLLRFKTWNDVWSGVTHGAAGFYPLSTRGFQNGKTHFIARLNVFFIYLKLCRYGFICAGFGFSHWWALACMINLILREIKKKSCVKFVWGLAVFLRLVHLSGNVRIVWTV